VSQNTNIEIEHGGCHFVRHVILANRLKAVPKFHRDFSTRGTSTLIFIPTGCPYWLQIFFLSTNYFPLKQATCIWGFLQIQVILRRLVGGMLIIKFMNLQDMPVIERCRILRNRKKCIPTPTLVKLIYITSMVTLLLSNQPSRHLDCL
jgi:hypothetical protein